MAPFWKPKPQPKHTESAAQWAAKRRDELRALLENYDTALDDLGNRMRDFRQSHTVLQGGRIVFISDDPHSRAKLEQEWRSLVQHRDSVLRERNSVLAELAALKTEMATA